VTTTESTAPVQASPPAGSRRGQTRRALHDMRPTLRVVGGLLFATVVAVAIAYAPKSSSGPAGDIQATTVNYKITMSTTLKAGKHTIGLTNKGTIGHELVLFKTALLANDLPLKPGGDVNEESPQLTSVGDSGEPLKAGGTESFKTDDLSPGHYVAVCNLPGHYKLGMKLNVKVQ
jgi:uncharacterized cupredoxin-like copper-binding protein